MSVSYRSNIEKRHQDLIRACSGGPSAVQLDLTEALQVEARDFVDSIRCARRPQADGESGLRVVRLLELACRSLERSGAVVAVPAGLC